MRDRDTGRSRGFGFVTMGDSAQADRAIQEMHDQELDGRRIKVNLANARGGGGGGGLHIIFQMTDSSKISSGYPSSGGGGGGGAYSDTFRFQIGLTKI